MLLYYAVVLMLYVMFAYLMLVAALSIAVCLYNALKKNSIDFLKFFLFNALSWFIDT